MGTLMFTIEGFDQEAAQTLDRWTVQKRLGEVGPQYGLVRRDGFVFAFPGKGQATVNMTHVETPLNPLGYRSEEHTSGLQSLMRISYAVFCLKKKIQLTMTQV